MKVPLYLIISNHGSVRVNRQKPSLRGNEVSVYLNLNIPDQIFEKPYLQAEITIPEEAVTKTPINAEIKDNVAKAIEQATGLNFSITVQENPETDQELKKAEQLRQSAEEL